DEIPESERPPCKRSCLFTIWSRDVGYGIRDTWIDPAEAVPAIAPTIVKEVNTKVVELTELHEHDIQDFHTLLEDAQDGRSRISQQVNKNSQQVDLLMGKVNTKVVELTELHEHDIQDFHTLLDDAQDGRSRISQQVNKNSQQVDLLMGDRMTLQETVWTVEEEAYATRTHQTQLQLQSTLIQTQHQVSETRFQIQQTAMAKLRETDRERQVQLTETLRVLRDMRQEMSDMQKELISQQEQLRRERQPGPDA
nr:hypothetical protein [Tanacetum cinerariifolium]